MKGATYASENGTGLFILDAYSMPYIFAAYRDTLCMEGCKQTGQLVS